MTFEVPVSWFYMPPERVEDAPAMIHADGSDRGQPVDRLLRTLFGSELPEIVVERLEASETWLSPDAREKLASIVDQAVWGQVWKEASSNVRTLYEVASAAELFSNHLKAVLSGTRAEVEERLRGTDGGET